MKRISRLLIGLGLIALMMPLFMTSASAVSTTYNGLGEGLVVFGTTGPYEQAMVQNTDAGPTYCVSIDTEIYPGDILNESSFAGGAAAAPGGQLTVAALQTIYRIVTYAYSNENPAFPLLGNNDQKAAGVQSAIWSFSNNWQLDEANPQNDPVAIANYNLIHGWVDGDSANGEYPGFVSEPAASLTVDSSATTANSNEKAGPFTIHVQDGTSKVKVAVTDGTAVDSANNPIDPNYMYGDGEQFYLTRTTAGVASAVVSGDVTSPPGRVFVPEIVDHQVLIALKSIEGTSTVKVEATFSDPAVVVPPPTVGGISITNNPPQVLGESVTRPAVSGTLATTGLNGMSIAALALGVAMLLLGLTLSSFKKLGEIHAV